jgi:hypothetical protein
VTVLRGLKSDDVYCSTIGCEGLFERTLTGCDGTKGFRRSSLRLGGNEDPTEAVASPRNLLDLEVLCKPAGVVMGVKDARRRCLFDEDFVGCINRGVADDAEVSTDDAGAVAEVLVNARDAGTVAAELVNTHDTGVVAAVLLNTDVAEDSGSSTRRG